MGKVNRLPKINLLGVGTSHFNFFNSILRTEKENIFFIQKDKVIFKDDASKSGKLRRRSKTKLRGPSFAAQCSSPSTLGKGALPHRAA